MTPIHFPLICLVLVVTRLYTCDRAVCPWDWPFFFCLFRAFRVGAPSGPCAWECHQCLLFCLIGNPKKKGKKKGEKSTRFLEEGGVIVVWPSTTKKK